LGRVLHGDALQLLIDLPALRVVGGGYAGGDELDGPVGLVAGAETLPFVGIAEHDGRLLAVVGYVRRNRGRRPGLGEVVAAPVDVVDRRVVEHLDFDGDADLGIFGLQD